MKVRTQAARLQLATACLAAAVLVGGATIAAPAVQADTAPAPAAATLTQVTPVIPGVPTVDITMPLDPGTGQPVTQNTLDKGSKDTLYGCVTVTTDPCAEVVVSDGTGAVQVDDVKSEVKGRGNYTWTHLAKKPYQFKLSKGKSLLGMDPAKNKTWVLLANAADGSLMRNKVALDLARAVGMPGASDSRFVNLRINGVYRGSYQLTDKVQVNDDRVNLTDPAGVLVELDDNYYDGDPAYGGYAATPPEPFQFTSATGHNHYVLDDAVGDVPDSAPLTDPGVIAGWNAAKDRINQLDAELAKPNPDWSWINSNIDVDSFVKDYFVYELTENPEGIVSSVDYYMNGVNDKLHAGPPWDFDSALFNYSTYSPGVQGDLGIYPDNDYYKNANILRLRNPSSSWIYNLFRIPEFQTRANQLWDEGIGAAVNQIPANIDTYQSQLTDSANKNFASAADGGAGWTNVLGHPTLLIAGLGHTYAPTYAGEVSYLKTQVTAHINLMNSEYGIPAPQLRYRANANGLGWMSYVNTAEVAGTVGQSRPLVGLDLSMTSQTSGGISAKVYVGGAWKTQSIGSIGGGSIQGLQFQLTGAMAGLYNISYRAQVAHIGWQSWVSNGATAGAPGSYAIEAIEIRLLTKTPRTPANLPVQTFLDVGQDNPFFADIEWLAAQGITTGYADGGFHPTAGNSRQAMAAYLYRFAGSPSYTPPGTSPFLDVKPTDAFYQQICWLNETGIDTGTAVTGGRNFDPTATVTRESMALMLYRFAGSPAFTPPDTSPFTDVTAADTESYKAITWLFAQGVTTGYDNGNGTVSYHPTEPVSRQAMAAYFHRYDTKGLPKPVV